MNNCELNTGDLILFHGKTSLFSRIIEYFTKTPYSHIGMIVVNPKFTNPPLNGVYLWESCNEDFGDSEDKKFKVGVELSDFNKILEERQNNYDLYIRKYKGPEITTEKLLKIHNIVKDKPYDINIIDWIMAYYRKDIKPQKTNRFWCSALIGYIYTTLGYLSPSTDWSILYPSDFSNKYGNLDYIGIELEYEKILL